MKTENEIKAIVAKNITFYRKQFQFTQLQLAEKLNYSDKTISKWERAESLPDLYLLYKLSQLFSIDIEDLVSDKPLHKIPRLKMNRPVITLIVFTAVWTVATAVYVFLEILNPLLEMTWLAFIYAIPLSLIVLLVFSKVWGNRIHLFISISLLIWTSALSILLSFTNGKLWLFFIICIPLQIIAILWLIIKPKIKTVL